ncbi:acetolactate synthase large subunit [Gluconobacter sp.]|uniref:acetolactate synthase large subunit n=1 Tax=Gluconobacter sp. TaxID=1876758 RepID=UPI0039E9A422
MNEVIPMAHAKSRFPTGAETLVSSLAASGIDVCFANPGTSEMHFVAALDKINGIRPILCLFEGVATGAADGYARIAGKPASTLLHLGPGLGNGLANLHNAKRASVPMVNIVGNHASYHLQFDAPLTSDVAGFARPVSDWVHTSQSARTVPADAARAVQAARAAPGQIATLILPADTAWLPGERASGPLPVSGASDVSAAAIDQCVAALRSGRKTAILLRGAALTGAGLRAAGRIAAQTHARLFCDTFAPRIERGVGRIPVERLQYRADEVVQQLCAFETLILVGAQPPVAFFAYPGKPSWLTPETCTILTLSYPHEAGSEAVEMLANALGAPEVRLIGSQSNFTLPEDDILTAEAVVQIVACLLPENSIVADEGLTSTFPNYDLLATAAPHDHLNLTGGSIGGILPLGTGAAVAAPERKVVCLEGDGSGMYTLQALWTQAREKLDVITIIFANRSYSVLNQELERVGVATAGLRARSLFDLRNPEINWVNLAQGMGVEAVSVDTVKEFYDVLSSVFLKRGPFLIEAVI